MSLQDMCFAWNVFSVCRWCEVYFLLHRLRLSAENFLAFWFELLCQSRKWYRRQPFDKLLGERGELRWLDFGIISWNRRDLRRHANMYVTRGSKQSCKHSSLSDFFHQIFHFCFSHRVIATRFRASEWLISRSLSSDLFACVWQPLLFMRRFRRPYEFLMQKRQQMLALFMSLWRALRSFNAMQANHRLEARSINVRLVAQPSDFIVWVIQ